MTEAAYREGYRYLHQLVTSLEPSVLSERCPHCPDWTLKDVLIHLMLVAEGGAALEVPANFRQRVLESIINADDEDQAAAAKLRDESWNRAVESASSLTIDEIWSRWETAQEREPGPWRFVVDFAVHVGDIEEAVGASGSRQMRLHADSLQRYATLANEQMKARGLPTVRFELRDPSGVAGDPDAGLVVKGPTYDVLRVMTGRRTAAEAHQLSGWGDVSAEAQRLLPIYGLLAESRQHERVV